jgi:hypothetical protein
MYRSQSRETQKLFDETRKLEAERRHFDRQSWQSLAIAMIALVASIIAIAIRR